VIFEFDWESIHETLMNLVIRSQRLATCTLASKGGHCSVDLPIDFCQFCAGLTRVALAYVHTGAFSVLV